MSGYVAVVGPCFLCGRVFSFNPHRVPSYDPSHDDPSQPAGREPICESCIGRVNEIRRRRGLEPWPVYADSYDAVEVSEL